VGFLPAYRNFTNATNEFLRAVQLPEYQLDIDHSTTVAPTIKGSDARSPLMLYLTMSVMFAGLAGILIFPNFRYAKMYTGAVRTVNALEKLALHFTFLFPLIALLLWTHPVQNYILYGPRKLLTMDQLDSLRIFCVLMSGILRLLMRKSHLQAHLNLANERIVRMRKENGYINSMELQRMIFRFFSYICAASIQYFAPVLLQLFLVLMLKTLGGYSWLGQSFAEQRPLNDPDGYGSVSAINTVIDPTTLAALNTVFNKAVMRGLLGFTVIMVLIINLSLSTVCVVYNSYFAVY